MASFSLLMGGRRRRVENNGYIDAEHVRDIIRALDGEIGDEELDEVVDALDDDGSGTVDYERSSSSPPLVRHRFWLVLQSSCQ